MYRYEQQHGERVNTGHRLIPQHCNQFLTGAVRRAFKVQDYQDSFRRSLRRNGGIVRGLLDLSPASGPTRNENTAN